MMPVENIQIQLIDTPPLNKDYVEPELFNLVRGVDIVMLVVDLQAGPIRQLEECLEVLREQRIVPLRMRERYAERRRLIFKPFLVVVNKNDDQSTDEDFEILCALLEEDWGCLPVSVASGRNLEQLKHRVVEELGIIRVYSRAPGREPDFTSPFVLREGSTVADFAEGVHRDFYENLKTARVWGSSSAFDGQMVQRDHVLQDGDVVELRM
jgi:hypothetical protein